MDVMINSDAKTPRSGPGGRSVKRLDFEMALELGTAGGRSFSEIVQQAAFATGGDLLFVLPAPDGNGMTALVHMPEDGESRFLQVGQIEGRFLLREGTEIDGDLLGFARASLDVLERLRADRHLLSPQSSASH